MTKSSTFWYYENSKYASSMISKNEMGVNKDCEEQVTSIKMENGPGLEEMSERDMRQFMI